MPIQFAEGQADRQLSKSIEHRLQIEGRAADHLEHVRRGGLLLQQFAQLAEQPGVLDGDDGLAGKCLQNRELFIREGSGREANDVSAPIASLPRIMGMIVCAR